MTKLADQYLTFDNSEGLIDENLYNMILDCFEKKYKDICDFFNYGEILKTSIVPVPDYKGVAATYTETGKVIMVDKYATFYNYCRGNDTCWVSYFFTSISITLWTSIAFYFSNFAVFNSNSEWAS